MCISSPSKRSNIVNLKHSVVLKIFGLYSHEDLTIDITMDDELSYLKVSFPLHYICVRGI